MKTLFLDTETTGLRPPQAKIVEVAIVDEHGETLLDTLVHPGGPIPSGATDVHGITDAMVLSAPSLQDLWPKIQGIVTGQHVVIYNADYDTRFFPDGLRCAGKISCAMQRFAPIYGEKGSYGDYKWQSLTKAARHVGYQWTGKAHRALADTLAARAVWMWMEAQ